MLAESTRRFHADGGIFQNKYDVFGDRRTTINEVGRTEAYVYDGMGRLIEQTHELRAGSVQLIDSYDYDGLGQRTKHWNSQLGGGGANLEKTVYDVQGRVIKMVDMGGNVTDYAYAFDEDLETEGLGTFGGWQKTTYDAGIEHDVIKTDLFGRVIDRQDFGSHDYDYTYDAAGRLVTTAIINDSITNGWYNTGQAKSVVSDELLGTTRTVRTSDYQYDVFGRRTFESYKGQVTLNGGSPTTTTYQTATATWDSNNRMVRFSDTGATGTNDNAAVDWKYDLAGNIRNMLATYYKLTDAGTFGSETKTDDFWYKYDGMNRFTLTKGQKVGTVVSRGLTGTDIVYDKAGQRAQTIRTISSGYFDYAERREDYTYTNDGYLSAVRMVVGPAGTSTTPEHATAPTVVQAAYTRDAMGRVTSLAEYLPGGTTIAYTRDVTYNAKSEITTETTSTLQDGTNKRTWATSTYFYDSTGNGQGTYLGGVVTRVNTEKWRTEVGELSTHLEDTSTTYTYEWWDQARQVHTEHDSNVGSVNDTIIETDYSYDAFGGLIQTEESRGASVLSTVSYKNDTNGQIFQRSETIDDHDETPSKVFYYFDGQTIGDISNDGTTDVDYVTSIDKRYVVGNNGVFRYGASTGTPYGDFDQSYDPINGFNYGSTSSRYTVQSGDTLSSIAQAVWGDSSLWYEIADVNGLDGTETLIAGQNLVIPNKVTNIHNDSSTYRVYDPNAAIDDASPSLVKPPKKGGCGIFGQILLAVIAVAVTYFSAGSLTTALGPVLGGALAGAAGSVASQAVGLATGIQTKFDFKGLALAAVGGAVGGGLKELGKFAQVNKIGGAFGKVANFVSGSGIINSAVRGVLGSVITQGVGVATKLQGRFDWGSVAAAGVGGGVDPMLGGGVLGSIGGGLAGAAAASLVTGRDFGDTLISSLPSIISNTVGNLLAGQVAGDSGNGSGQGSGSGDRRQTLTEGHAATNVGNTAGSEVVAAEAQHGAAAAQVGGGAGNNGDAQPEDIVVVGDPHMRDLLVGMNDYQFYKYYGRAGEHTAGNFAHNTAHWALGLTAPNLAASTSGFGPISTYDSPLLKSLNSARPLPLYSCGPGQQYMLGDGSVFTGTPTALYRFEQQRSAQAGFDYLGRLTGPPIGAIALGTANSMGASSDVQDLVYGLGSAADGLVMAYAGVRGAQIPGIGSQTRPQFEIDLRTPGGTTVRLTAAEAGGRIIYNSPIGPVLPATKGLTTADFPTIGTTVSNKQLRHLGGTPEHAARNNGGGGYLNSMNDAQAVLDAYHSGGATILGKNAQGFPIVRIDGITGTNVNIGAGIQNQATNVFIIKGTVKPSVVPTNPFWKP